MLSAVSYIKKMKYDRNILSERMIQTRGKRSQGEMARRLGITQAYLSEIERGKKIPSNQVLVAIAEVYGTSVAYLLGEIESPEPLVPMYRTQPQMPGKENFTNSGEFSTSSIRNNDLPVYSPAQLAAQLKNSFVTHPFVIITEKAHMENLQIPDGAEVTINPLESYCDFDIVLVYFKGVLTLKRISFKVDGGFDLIDSRGIAAVVSKKDLETGLFKVGGKAVSVTYKINHGL